MKHIVMLLLCVINLLHAEGFVADTLVHTQQGLIAIENVYSGDYVTIDCGNQLSSYVVTNTTSNTVDQFIKITIKEIELCLAADQKLYVLNKGWVRADELVLSDLLLCENKKYVEIAVFEVVHKKQKMYSFSVESSHVFCVTKYGIIVHNVEPVGAGVATIAVSFCPPLGGAVILGEIIAFGVAGIAGYLIHKKSKQDAKQNRYPIIEGPDTCPCGGKPPRHDEDKDEHPNGIYEDAGYHHFHSKGKKSPSPQNGQACLDRSLPINDYADQRVAMEVDKFVIFKETSRGRYHGYCMTWKDIVSGGNSFTEAVRKTLVDSGWVSKTGKVIKGIIK